MSIPIPRILLENIEHQHCAVGLGPMGCMLSVLAVRAPYVPDIGSLCKQWIRRGSLGVLASAYTELPGLIREMPYKYTNTPEQYFQGNTDNFSGKSSYRYTSIRFFLRAKCFLLSYVYGTYLVYNREEAIYQ